MGRGGGPPDLRGRPARAGVAAHRDGGGGPHGPGVAGHQTCGFGPPGPAARDTSQARPGSLNSAAPAAPPASPPSSPGWTLRLRPAPDRHRPRLQPGTQVRLGHEHRERHVLVEPLRERRLGLVRADHDADVLDDALRDQRAVGGRARLAEERVVDAGARSRRRRAARAPRRPSRPRRPRGRSARSPG